MTVQVQHVAVLYGGPSSEREVSLCSGVAVADALDTQFAQVDRVIVNGRQVDLDAGVDCVFIALHGEFGEDGQVQQILEDRSVPFVGSDSAASRLAMDKVQSKRRLDSAGIPVLPDWVLGPSEPVPPEMRPPVVVKPVVGGSSIGVRIVRQPEDLASAIAEARSESRDVLIEPYLDAREFTVSVLDSGALPVIEVCPRAEFYDYRVKYTPGGTEYRVPAPLPQAVSQQFQKVGEQAHRALGCRHLSRVDMLWDNLDRLVVLEVNTIPGFTATSLFPKAAQAAGIGFPELCKDLVMAAVKEGNRNNSGEGS